MWSSEKSVKLSFAVCCVVTVLIVVFDIVAPWAVNFYFEKYRGISMDSEMKWVVFPCVYLCSFIGLAALAALMKLLKNIRNNNPFCNDNVKYLRRISLYCFAVAAVTLICGFIYIPFFFVAVPAGFVGMILRVVKNVMQSAVKIREENDLTI